MATQSETAANFGYTLAFFNSNPELKSLLAKAMGDPKTGAGAYTEARFIAELQNTRWFRTTSESNRKYLALKSGDPATFKSQLGAINTHIWDVGGQMGASLSNKLVDQLANQAMSLGWNDEQLKRMIASYVKPVDGTYRGLAGAAESELKKAAGDYGVSISDSTMAQWIKGIALGLNDPQQYHIQIQKMAASKYVALKDRIMQGETVRQIADPYIQSYAKTLEVNADNVGLDDRLVQQALQSRNKDGKPTTQTLYDFENTLRNDPRWAKTNNARDLMASTANQILQTFGLSS